jgi:hypothetical protein
MKTCGACKYIHQDPHNATLGWCTWLESRMDTTEIPPWFMTRRVLVYLADHKCPAWVTGISGGGLPE